MRILSAFRDREFSLARVTRALALAAAMVFALLPGITPPAWAMAGAAPPGFIAVCTSEGVAFVPAGDFLPLDAPPGAEHGGRCLHCCPAQIAALIPGVPPLPVAPRWSARTSVPPPAVVVVQTVVRALPRGPPTA